MSENTARNPLTEPEAEANATDEVKCRTTEAEANDEEVDEGDDEKVLRRRLQYKLHQRRHRAKQQQKVAALDLEVQSLVDQIETFDRKRQRLLVDSNYFAARGTVGGVPVHVALEFFRLFQFGASSPDTSIDQQEQFLRAVMTADTKGPDYLGVDTIATQWRYYYSLFASTRYEVLATNVTTVGDLTMVDVGSIFSIRTRHEGVVTLFPSVNGDVVLTQKLVGNALNVPVKYTFTFDSNGIVTWFGAEWDLVGALHRTLSDLTDVSMILSSAKISSSTGQILVEETTSKVDPRLNVDYLLIRGS